MDIQKIFRIEGKGEKAGTADPAALLIDPSYLLMKKQFVKDLKLWEGHNYWAWKPLTTKNLEYVAVDGYLSYEIYRWIRLVNDGQRHIQPPPTLVICPNCKNVEGSETSKVGRAHV